MKRHLVIIRGPSGVGKSTVAKEVVERLGSGTAYVTPDITTEHLMRHNEHLTAPTRKIIGLIYDNAEHLVNNMLAFGFSVVTEGMFSFKDKSRTRIQRMVGIGKKHGASVLVFDLNASLSTLQKRAKRRGRKDDKMTNYALVDQRYKTFSRDQYKNSIKLDVAKMTQDQIVDEILKRIK